MMFGGAELEVPMLASAHFHALPQQPVPGTGETVVSKTDKVSALQEPLKVGYWGNTLLTK